MKRALNTDEDPMKAWKRRTLASFAISFACAQLAGCGVFFPSPNSSADRAKEIEPTCREFSEQSAMPLMSARAIESVEPAYSYVLGGPNGRDAHLRGARILVRPAPGVSAESLSRSLLCHEARVTLGLATPLTNDPYVLQDSWLSIDVTSIGTAFAILVQAESFDDARRTLERAQAFSHAGI